MQELTFSKNKTSRIQGLIIASIMVVLSTLLLLYCLQQESTVGTFLFTFFTLTGLFLIYKNVTNAPTVLVNETGLQTEVNKMGWIEWQWIEGFAIKQAVNSKVIVVAIHDQEALLNSKNKVTRALMASNIASLGSPVVLPEAAFNIPLEEVVEQLETYRKWMASLHPSSQKLGSKFEFVADNAFYLLGRGFSFQGKVLAGAVVVGEQVMFSTQEGPLYAKVQLIVKLSDRKVVEQSILGEDMALGLHQFSREELNNIEQRFDPEVDAEPPATEFLGVDSPIHIYSSDRKLG